MTIYPDIDLNRWEVENNCNVVLANADYYYTKGQVDEKIDDINISGVTEEKVERMIDKSLQDYYSKNETDSFINKLEETDTTISGDVSDIEDTLDTYFKESAKVSKFDYTTGDDYVELQFPYYKNQGDGWDNETNLVEIEAATESSAGVMSAEDKRKLGNTYTKTEIDNAISAITSGKADSDSVYTKSETDNKIEEAVSGKADTSAVTEAISAIDAAYKAADAVISGAVNNVSGDVVTEAQRAQNAETALNSKIDEVSGAIPSVESYFDGAEYDSNAKRINFKHGGTVKTYIDATDFIKDGMVSNVEIIDDNLVITFNSDAGKETITIPLTDIFNPNNYYTKSDTNNLLDDKVDKVNTYTKTEVDAVLSGKQETLISGTNIKTINNESILGSGNIDVQGSSVTVDSELSTTSENPVQNKVITNTLNEKERAISIALNDLEERKIDESGLTKVISAATNDMATQTWVSGFTYDKSTIDDMIEEGGGFIPENYYDKTATDNLLNAKANNNEVVKLTGAQNITGEKTFVGNKLIKFKQTATSNKLGFTLYNNNNIETSSFEFRPDTFTESDGKHALLYLGHYRTTSDAASVNQSYVGFRQYDQSNNAAYHILAPLPQNAKTTFELTTTFKDFYMPLGFKVDSTNTVLSDNSGLVDLSNEFSAKADTTALGGLTLVKLTQAEYDALATKDSNTLYVIVG